MGDELDDYNTTHRIVALIFGITLVQVEVPHSLFLRDELIPKIFNRDDLHPEVQRIMKVYKPRHLRFLRLLSPVPIHDLDTVPPSYELLDMKLLDPDRGRFPGTPREDGTFLNLIIEQPLPILQLPAQSDQRLRSREVALYLDQYQIECWPENWRRIPVGLGRMGPEGVRVWCKLVPRMELEAYELLAGHHPEDHHVSRLVIDSCELPTNQHLIVLPDYGTTLEWWDNSAVEDDLVLRLAPQLCEAVQFLHSHNVCHLDIKPHNIALDNSMDILTVIDLGWAYKVPRGGRIKGATGTYDFSPPEVVLWHDWEALDDDDDSPPPPSFDPYKADVWAVGNVIRKWACTPDVYVDRCLELFWFGEWMMKNRPSIEDAIQRLKTILDPSLSSITQ